MCLGNGGCHDVNFSPYSEIAGIPVSVFGLVAYLTMAVILLLESRLNFAKDNGPLAVFGISLAAYGVYRLSYMDRALCDPYGLPVLCGVRSHYHLDFYSGHYPAS